MASQMYTIDEIKERIIPVAREYGVSRVALFGSYARGEATPKSDIDLHIDSGAIRGLFKLSGFQLDIQKQFSVGVDVLTTGSLDDDFLARIKKDEVVLYEQ